MNLLCGSPWGHEGSDTAEQLSKSNVQAPLALQRPKVVFPNGAWFTSNWEYSYPLAFLSGHRCSVPNYYWESLAVQWLELCALTDRDPGSVPDWGTKIPQTVQHDQK